MKEEDESVSVLEQAATSEEPLAGETTGESQETGRGDRLQPIDSETRRRSGDVNSRFLYVVEQGAVLRRNSGHVQVTKGENNLLEVPIVKLQGVLLYGNIQVTTQCIRHLLDEGIWVSFLSRGGRYKGRLQSPHDKGARLRRMQWQRSQDPDFCLEFGRAVVRGKLAGQMKVASAYAKNYLAQTLGEGHRILKESVERLKDVDNLDELRGVEG
ncbi:MAG TPA: CRISPR-associated endonuclease Cas1, partial [Terriglobia bacterium]|nr:CRISPR-associated endonuclease Cas1 [Terriglobia bacterium]